MRFLSLLALVVVSLFSSIAILPDRATSFSRTPQVGLSNHFVVLKPQAERKIAYGILIDNTGSLRSQFDIIKELSKGIVARTHQLGPISLFPFTTQSKKVGGPAVISAGIEWSQDKDQLDKYIDSVFVVPGQTTLIDAINTIAAQLNAKVEHDKDEFAGKTIFLITDGEDRLSRTSEKDLLNALKNSGINVYAVGPVKELDDEGGLIRKPPRQKAVAFLEKITKETGGRVTFPKAKKVDVEGTLNVLLPK